MTIKKVIIFSSLIITVLLLVIFILLKYYSCGLLTFDSSEFNNIATPIISLFGVIGLLITIFISIEQIRYIRSEQYYRDLLDKFEKISKEQNSELMFPNIQIIKFFDYVERIYNQLTTEYPEYLSDLERFKKGERVISLLKDYDKILGNVRLFNAQAFLLYTQLLNLIKEIESHKYLVFHHRDLLLDNLISVLVSDYITSLWLINKEYSNLFEDFYVAFYPIDVVKIDDMKFFSSKFLELRDYIFSKKKFKKYFDNYAQ